jgi:lysyl-tRNA synthetase class II
MGEDIRKMIDKVKNWKQFLNENVSNEKSVDVEFNKIELSKFNSLRNLTLQDIVDNWTNVQNMKNDNIDTITYFINNQSELNTKCLSYDKNGLADGYHRLIAMKILNIKTFCYNYEDEYSGD